MAGDGVPIRPGQGTRTPPMDTRTPMRDHACLDAALERLLADGSPIKMRCRLTVHEEQMLQIAQLLRGCSPHAPCPTFVSALHKKIVTAPA